MIDLFQRIDLSSFLNNLHLNRAIGSVGMLDADYVLQTSEEEIIATLLEEHRFVPITITGGVAYGDPVETRLSVSDYGRQIQVPGFYIDGHIPYTGDKTFFNASPQSRVMAPLRAVDITDNELVIRHTFRLEERDRIAPTFERDVRNMEVFITSIRTMVEDYNARLAQSLLDVVRARKQELASHKSLLSDLGLPRKIGTVPQILQASTLKRKIKPHIKRTESAVAEPEYELEMKEYEYIVGVLKNMSRSMERSWKTFVGFDEEQIRDMFLVNLNGHYDGNVTGETFNSIGKTDLLLRQNDRNVFIAECKFWTGEEGLIDTIDQLTKRYLTYRDSRAAVLIFSRNKNFTAVLQQIPGIIKKYPDFKAMLIENTEQGEFRFILRYKNDPNREIMVTLLAFDVPSQA